VKDLPGGLQGILDMAQKMQSEMGRVKSEAEQKIVEGSAGGGVVTVKMNGAMQTLSVTIDPSAVNPEDVAMLQDLVRAAVNEAVRKAKDLLQSDISQLTGGLNIPGLSF
jgi:DNA-binding YbaB/EbfC family protein